LSNGFDGEAKGLNHSFAIVDNNADAVWFTSRIFSFVKNYGATGDIIGGSVNIEINSTLTASGGDYEPTEPNPNPNPNPEPEPTEPEPDPNPEPETEPETEPTTERGAWTTSGDWVN